MTEKNEQLSKDMYCSFERSILMAMSENDKLRDQLKHLNDELNYVNDELKDVNAKFSDFSEKAKKKIFSLKENNQKAQNQFYQIMNEKDLTILNLEKQVKFFLNVFLWK
jgi:hypothetical protein